MHVRRIVAGLLAVALVLAAGLAAATSGGMPRVYKVGEITLDRYVVIERIWVGTLRSAIWVPTYADQTRAIEAVLAAAERRGADGIVNLHCLHDGGGLPPLTGYFCYANAIKLKQVAPGAPAQGAQK